MSPSKVSLLIFVAFMLGAIFHHHREPPRQENGRQKTNAPANPMPTTTVSQAEAATGSNKPIGTVAEETNLGWRPVVGQMTQLPLTGQMAVPVDLGGNRRDERWAIVGPGALRDLDDLGAQGEVRSHIGRKFEGLLMRVRFYGGQQPFYVIAKFRDARPADH